MTTADRYRRLAEIFDRTVAEVADWDAPSPCAGWSARDVLEHVAHSEAESVNKVGLRIDRTIGADTDPLGSWREVRDALQTILDDPTMADREYESLGSMTTLAAAIDRYFCFDLIVHRWDIATAAGLSIVIPATDIADANTFLDSVGQMFYDYGASGPAIVVANDASPQDKLLGRAGRDTRSYRQNDGDVMTTTVSLQQIVLDTSDVHRLAEFYRQLLNFRYRPGDDVPPAGQPDPRGQDWLVLLDPAGKWRLAFQQVANLPEPTWPEGPYPQMAHLDLTVPSLRELQAEHLRVIGLGARLLQDRSDDSEDPLRVYADPAGHPFCIFLAANPG